MSDSLKHKTIKGVGWSFLDNIASGGITFLIGLVLARLLTPEEFGIIGMITIFIAISNSIVDSGFSNALIRKNNAKDIDYNTVFYFNLGISIVLYIILFSLAPIISRFFNEPILIPVTRVLGIVLIINGLAIIQRTLLFKDIDFKTQAKISALSSIFSGIVGIVMAVAGCGVWSLVGQQITRQFLNTSFLWIFRKWRPSLIYSYKSFKELFSFGSKLLVIGLIDTVFKNIYYLVIGRFYTANQLGQYTRAEQFNTIFSSNLVSVVMRVSYPVLSSIQNEPERLKLAYQSIIKTTMLVTFACMLGLAAIAKPLIILLIGNKWLEAASFLPILCFAGMFQPLHALNLNALQVKGRSDICLKLEIIKKTIAVIPILLGVFFGIKIMLWGSVFTSFIFYFLNSYYSADIINYSTKEQLLDILPSFVISVIVALCMWSITLFNLSYIFILFLQIIVGIILAVIFYEKVNLIEYQESKKIVESFFKNKNKCKTNR